MGVIIELIFFGLIAVAITNAKKKKGSSGKSWVEQAKDAVNTVSEVVEKAAKENSPGGHEKGKSSEEENEPESVRPFKMQTPFPSPVKPVHSSGQSRQVKELCGLFGEDRRHDWMARQLREERRHMVWNNFQDLGARHDLSCAAQEARLAHRREHDSGVIDDGIVDE